MAVSSSNLVDNLAEGIQKNQCKDCDCFLQCQNSIQIQSNINAHLTIKNAYHTTRFTKN